MLENGMRIRHSLLAAPSPCRQRGGQQDQVPCVSAFQLKRGSGTSDVRALSFSRGSSLSFPSHRATGAFPKRRCSPHVLPRSPGR